MNQSPYRDLERPPLVVKTLRRALVAPASLWKQVDVVQSTGSTNDDLRAFAQRSKADGVVLVAEEQRAGKGRLERTWTAPARSALTFSMLLRPTAAVSSWGWLPLLAAVAAVDALAQLNVGCEVKWPNDVLLHERKLGGILAERVDSPHGTAVVIGMGLNVSLTRDELPTPWATSLLLHQQTTDRQSLLTALLRAIEARYLQWQRGDIALVRARYIDVSATVGQRVRIQQHTAGFREGVAAGIDESGHLIFDADGERQLLAAADVTHLRAMPGESNP